MELASQLIENGGDIDCLDWGDVGTSAVGGLGSGAVGGVFGKALSSLKGLPGELRERLSRPGSYTNTHASGKTYSGQGLS